MDKKKIKEKAREAAKFTYEVIDDIFGKRILIFANYASSHMARRTFCGNVYKNVKDPSIVGSMSGHKEGSKALARYRDIDQDIKKDALSVFE